MIGPCAKQTVRATIVAINGESFTATNHCDTPQATCPRAGMKTGEGYELCRSICHQPAHAEVNAVAMAGDRCQGATLYLEGHTYACDACRSSCDAAGIAAIVIGSPSGRA